MTVSKISGIEGPDPSESVSVASPANSRVRIQGLEYNGIEGTTIKLLPNERLRVMLVSLCEARVPLTFRLLSSFGVLLVMTGRELCRTMARR